MKTGKILLYAIAGLVALVAVAFVVQTVLALVSAVLTAFRLLAIFAVFAGLGYLGYKVYSLVSGGSESSTSNTGTGDEFSMDDIGTTSDVSTGTSSRSDDLRQKYLNGEISEEEFERRLERKIDGGEYDDIDRELQRERI